MIDKHYWTSKFTCLFSFVVLVQSMQVLVNLHSRYTWWGCGMKFQSSQVLDVQNFDKPKRFVGSVLLRDLVHTTLFVKVYGLNQSAVGKAAWVEPKHCWQ